MGRHQRILKHIRKEQRGIEIGPWFNPLASKRDGYNSLNMDVFATDELRRRAGADSKIPAEKIAQIEPVDLVGSANEIAEVVAAQAPPLGSFDYIVSSHNFEHIPNPIHFLQGCQKVLRPGGVLTMAVPDRRTCFDYFNPHSVTADFLEAYFAKRIRPTAKQVFRMQSLQCQFVRTDGEIRGGFGLKDDPQGVQALETLEEAYQTWQALESCPDDEYRDAHCWVFMPAALELILRDLRHLGLIGFDVMETSETFGHEFCVHLRNSAEASIVSRSDFYETRQRLLHEINDQSAVNARSAFRPSPGFRWQKQRRRVAAPIRQFASACRRLAGAFPWPGRRAGLAK